MVLGQTIKKDFPIFEEHKDLVYLDNAATSQRPRQVIDRIKEFYEKENANIHRGVYTLSECATQRYEEARKKVAHFINAEDDEIVFTKNTTECLNLLAYTIKELIPENKNEIVLTELEHHSNLVPWQEFAKRYDFTLKFIKIKDDYTLDLEHAKEVITDKTAVVSFAHISNVLGTILPVKELIVLAKNIGALTIVDAAQGVAHKKIDVKDFDCDFLCFSSHKMLGLTGVGVLYGKKEFLEKLPPFLFGGGMIKEVTYNKATFADAPHKFEAGTLNIAETIGLGESITYLENLGFEHIEEWEKELLWYALEKLNQVEGIKLFTPGVESGSAIISFTIDGIHPHDLASLLDSYSIAVRAGHHCAMPLMKKLGVSGMVRASFSVFNTKEDIDKLFEALNKSVKVFRK